MSDNETIGLPSVLAFERKLEISDGLMYAGIFDNHDKLNITIKKTVIDKKTGFDKEIEQEILAWQEIPITPRTNRATQSQYNTDENSVKKINPNITNADHAAIPDNCNTLKVSWTMRIIGNVGKPFSCNTADFETAVTAKVSKFKEECLKDLAFRYAYNIVNGRFLWRNRVCAKNVEIQVTIKGEKKPLPFNAYDFSLLDFDKNKDNEDLKKIAEVIYQGLMDETGENFSSIKVNAFVKLDESQQIFPSQEMNMNEKGKTLFQLNNCAAMHNVKIGNAIRTIDTWYSGKALAKAEGKNKTKSIIINDKYPIAIEPYGSVTQRGIAYRASKDDLYTLMLDWVNEEEISDDNKKYVIANLIRGGVFSKGSSK